MQLLQPLQKNIKAGRQPSCLHSPAKLAPGNVKVAVIFLQSSSFQTVSKNHGKVCPRQDPIHARQTTSQPQLQWVWAADTLQKHGWHGSLPTSAAFLTPPPSASAEETHRCFQSATEVKCPMAWEHSTKFKSGPSASRTAAPSPLFFNAFSSKSPKRDLMPTPFLPSSGIPPAPPSDSIKAIKVSRGCTERGSSLASMT